MDYQKLRLMIAAFTRGTRSRQTKMVRLHGLLTAVASICFSLGLDLATAAEIHADKNPLSLPRVGDHALTILSPTLLELTLITSKQPDPAQIKEWNFAGTNGVFKAPPPSEFQVAVGNRVIPVEKVGFKRRTLYAPLKQRDLRVGSYLYLQLAAPVPEGETVEVKNPGGRLWKTEQRFVAKADPLRWSPVVHVNQEGYLPGFSKIAMVGYFLGSMGELDFPANLNFKVIEAGSKKTVFEGKLHERRDRGYEPAAYRAVLEADFTELREPGEYKLLVPGYGTSFPFFINEGVAANLTRAYATGLYHQRCGAANGPPFSRFTHDRCHVAPAEVPDIKFEEANYLIAKSSANFSANSRHAAPQLKDVNTSLYPFLKKGKIDVSGGHHDAGDYSKYTINSAHLIHALVFAADHFPNAGTLDNLGIPESGDGKSDLLQEAKWEADFLAKMQDDDGGFYFLVYPRNRPYEHDVLPDKGDPQVVFPKTTAVTAAAVAALAQTATSPLFKKQFPEAAAVYLAKAKKGWTFLEKALQKHGRDGAYQKITHYGDEFIHDDEIAWAATEMFLATGDETIHRELLDHFNPGNPDTRRWSWWRLYEAYGCAIRSYAFAAPSKRIAADKLNIPHLKACEGEIVASAEDQLAYSRANAYGSSFPIESKRFRSAGWYFSIDRAFDLAVACQLEFPEMNDPRPEFIDALIANMNYEAGCNPVNVSYVSGIGWKRPREMVHHVAQNDHRILPPSGLSWGNIQEGFPWLDLYGKELGTITFPPDWSEKAGYPFYDRWGDSFNTSQEFTVINLGRSLAALSFLMGKTETAKQPWKPVPAEIIIKPNSNGQLSLELKTSLDLGNARVVWEIDGREPHIVANSSIYLAPANRPKWIEAEAHLPDGRRVAGIKLLK